MIGSVAGVILVDRALMYALIAKNFFEEEEWYEEEEWSDEEAEEEWSDENSSGESLFTRPSNTFEERKVFLNEHISFPRHRNTPIISCTGHAPSPSRSIPCPFLQAISPADDARLVDYLLYWPTYGRTFQDGRVIFPRRHGDTILIEDVDAVLQFCKVVKELSNRAEHSG